MNNGLKVSVIGGGSSYTPELIEGFIESFAELPVQEISLMDIDPLKLEIVGGLARRMIAAKAPHIRLEITTDRRQSLEGASFVVTQIRVGQMPARILDEKIPLQHGLIGQETTGAGGFAKALRTIPVMLDIAHEMEEVAPDATLVNFTNPAGLITEAVQKHSKIKSVGLCNIPYGTKVRIAELLGAPVKRITLDWIGLNHLNWVRRVYLDGVDVWDDFFPKLIAAAGTDARWGFSAELLQDLQLLPCSYLNYFYYPAHQLAKLQHTPRTRGEEVREIEAQLMQMYRDEKLASKPSLLEKRGGAYYSKAAVSLLCALHNHKNEIHIVNTSNRGIFAELPDDAVIEIPCRVGERGIQPLGAAALPPQVRGLVQQIKTYEALTVQAAVHGDRNAGLHALMAHPLVADVEKAKVVLEHLLQAHKSNLPQFFPGA